MKKVDLFSLKPEQCSLPKEKEYAQKEGECVLTVAREKVLNIHIQITLLKDTRVWYTSKH